MKDKEIQERIRFLLNRWDFLYLKDKIEIANKIITELKKRKYKCLECGEVIGTSEKDIEDHFVKKHFDMINNIYEQNRLEGDSDGETDWKDAIEEMAWHHCEEIEDDEYER